MRVLIVCCHGDDEVIGCGAVAHAHSDYGDHVSVIMATLTFNDSYTDEMKHQLSDAYDEVDRILGTKGRIIIQNKVQTLSHGSIGEIADVIRIELKAAAECDEKVRVYTHVNNDLNQDHHIVHLATMVAVRPSAWKFGKKINEFDFEVLGFEIPNVELGDNRWDMFVPLTSEDVDAQTRAMEAYKSEVPPNRWHVWHPEVFKPRAREIGSRIGVEYASRFRTLYRVGGLK